MSTASALALRAEFDRSFSVAPRVGVDSMLSVLALRVGGDPHAVLLDKLSGVARNEVIVPVPTASAAMLGLVGLRGVLLPVFDLGVLLGYAPERDPRWLLLVGKAPGLALGFQHFEAHVRLPSATSSGGGIVCAAGASRRLIDVDSLAQSIRNHDHG